MQTYKLVLTNSIKGKITIQPMSIQSSESKERVAEYLFKRFGNRVKFA